GISAPSLTLPMGRTRAHASDRPGVPTPVATVPARGPGRVVVALGGGVPSPLCARTHEALSGYPLRMVVVRSRVPSAAGLSCVDARGPSRRLSLDDAPPAHPHRRVVLLARSCRRSDRPAGAVGAWARVVCRAHEQPASRAFL